MGPVATILDSTALESHMNFKRIASSQICGTFINELYCILGFPWWLRGEESAMHKTWV